MKKLMKKIVATILIGVLALSLAGCGETSNTSSGTDESTGELKTIRLGIPGTEDTQVCLENGAVAFREGYLEEELNKVGYTLEPKYFVSGGPEINEALAANEIDFAIYGDFPAFVSKSNGIDTTVIGFVNSNIQFGVFVADESIFSEPKDVEGLRVAVAYGTISQYFWEDFVAENGIDVDKVEVVNTTDAQTLLASGDIDVSVSTIFQLQGFEDAGAGKIVYRGDVLERGYTTQPVVMLNSYLQENEDAAVAILKALQRAYDAAQENPQLVYDDLDSPNIPAASWEKTYSFDTSFKYFNPEITEELKTYLTDLNDWLYDHGIITSKIDIENFYDTSYYEKAMQ